VDADRRPSDHPAADSHAAVRRAAVSATLAHSHRDTEPWQIVVQPDALHLYADPDRWLLSTDPTGQALTLSVGCALLNARASLETQGVGHEVLRFPDPRRPQHVATILVTGEWSRPGAGARSALARLGAGGAGRHTVDATRSRLPRSDEIEVLTAAVKAEDARLHLLGPDVVAVATSGNRAWDWLVAGEAVQRLVLEAAGLGLAVAAVDGWLASPADRARLRDQIGGEDHPQAVLQLGAPGRTIRGRRRSLATVLH